MGRQYEGTQIGADGVRRPIEDIDPEAPAVHSYSGDRTTFALDAGLSGELALDPGGYAAGAQVTAGATVPGVVPALYRLARLKLVTGSTVGDDGDELPNPGIGLAIIPFDSDNEPDWGADGDPFTPQPAGGLGYESLGAEFLNSFEACFGSESYLLSTDTPVINVNPWADSIRLVPFTTEAIDEFTDDQILVIAGIIERVGGLPHGA